MKPAVTLLVPDLFFPPLRQVDIYQSVDLPALSTLLSRGSWQKQSASSAEAWLCRQFGLSGDNPPLAPLTLAMDGGEPGSAWWLRADPVYLNVMRDQLSLVTSDAFSLSQQEATELTDALNRHFAEDGLLFYPLHPTRWYLRFDQPPRLITTPPEAVAGKHIDPYLPKGEDGLKWHAWFNEIQMLLFSHPVNEAREERGETPVNSVWVWGGGTLPTLSAPPFQRIYAHDPVAAALALGSDTPLAHLPDNVAEVLAENDPSALVVLDNARGAVQYNDLYGWHESMQKLEQNWFAPLVEALKKGRISSLRIVSTGLVSAEITVKPLNLWQFWRRSKPMKQFLP